MGLSAASPNGRLSRSQRGRVQRLQMTQDEASQSIQRMSGLIVDISKELATFILRQGWKSLGYANATDCHGAPCAGAAAGCRRPSSRLDEPFVPSASGPPRVAFGVPSVCSRFRSLARVVAGQRWYQDHVSADRQEATRHPVAGAGGGSGGRYHRAIP